MKEIVFDHKKVDKSDTLMISIYESINSIFNQITIENNDIKFNIQDFISRLS